eukprot:TRINITY_DN9209_c0_g1_i1.p1 TRINITY_DN9209_c0_g1~~TRINITY_DN9209_c0_g1_i1.p1  ORF type:complete len:250 (-),score=53.16 TRINITY_DN9209_c0_g1_i1:7-756(-)
MTTPTGKRAVVVGATGSVGRMLVKTLALDPRVARVTAAVRKLREPGSVAAFYLLGDQPEAAGKVQEVAVDYAALSDAPTAGGVFEGHDIGFSGLGIYTAAAQSEAHFREVEVTANMRAAKAMRLGGVGRFAYLSGQGVTQTPGCLTPQFSRVKGEAERRLQTEVGFERCTVVRPAGIYDRPEGSTPAHALEGFMNNRMRFLLNTSVGIKCEEVAQAMVHSALAGEPVAPILENNDIRATAAAYRSSHKS